MNVYSDIAKYNLPVFEIKPKVTSTKIYNTITLNTCEIVDNRFNVTYNNNCIRWLRKVVAEKNPFFIDPPAIEFHLCSLYITPGYYPTIESLIAQINKDMLIAKSTWINNDDLLEDEYFQQWKDEDEAFKIEDGEITFQLSSILPVTISDDHYSTSNINKVISDDKTQLLYVKNILNKDLTVSKNKYRLLAYENQNSKIINTYYNYKQNRNGIYEQMGVAAARVSLPELTIYMLKSFNYSEEVYSGDITLTTPMSAKNIETIIPADSPISYNVVTYELVYTELMRYELYIIASYTPIVSNFIYFYETTNPDIESVINKNTKMNEIYRFKFNNLLEFSSDVRLTIPIDGKLYIYIGHPDIPYALSNGNYKLTYQYLN